MNRAKTATPDTQRNAALACCWHQGESGLATALFADGTVLLLRPAAGEVLGPLLQPQPGLGRGPAPVSGGGAWASTPAEGKRSSPRGLGPQQRPPANSPSSSRGVAPVVMAIISSSPPAGVLLGFPSGEIREHGLPDSAPASAAGRSIISAGAHTGCAVTVLAPHPSGRSFLLCDAGGKVSVYARATGSRLATFKPKMSLELPRDRQQLVRITDDDVRLLCMCVDSDYLVAGDEHGRLHTLDGTTLSPVLTQSIVSSAQPEGEPDCSLTAVILVKSEAILAVASGHLVRCKVATAGAPLFKARPSSTSLNALALSPTCTTVACGDALGVIFLCSATTGSTQATYDAHAGAIRQLAFGWQSGIETLWSAGNDARVLAWDCNTGLSSLALACAGRVTALALEPHGQRLAVGDGLGFLQVLDLVDGTESVGPHHSAVCRVALDLTGHTRAVKDVSWSASGERLASASEDGHVRVWDLNTGFLLLQLETLDSDWVIACAFAPGSPLLYACARHGQAARWRLASGERDQSVCLRGAGSLTKSRLWPGSHNALVLDGREARLVDGGDLHVVASYRPPRQGDMGACAVAPDLSFMAIAVASSIYVVCLAPKDDGAIFAEQHAALVARDFVRDLDFSADSKLLLAACNDGLVSLYVVDGGRGTPALLTQYEEHHSRITCARFAPRGYSVASGDAYGQLHVWILQGPTLTATFQGTSAANVVIVAGHHTAIKVVAWAHHKALVASGGEDCSVRLYGSSDGRPLCSHHLHRSFVVALHFSEDDRVLYSASNDNTMVAWDVAAHTVLLSVPFPATSRLLSMVSLDGGRRLVATGTAGTMTAVDTDPNFAIWLAAQAFFFTQRGSCSRHDQPDRESWKVYGQQHPLALSTHLLSETQETFMAWLLRYACRPRAIQECALGLMEGSIAPIHMDRMAHGCLNVVSGKVGSHGAPDGKASEPARYTILQAALERQLTCLAAALVENLRHHPLGESRLAFAGALPVLAERHPTLAVRLLHLSATTCEEQVPKTGALCNALTWTLQTDMGSGLDVTNQSGNVVHDVGAPRSLLVALPFCTSGKGAIGATAFPSLLTLARERRLDAFDTPAARAVVLHQWAVGAKQKFLQKLGVYLLFLIALLLTATVIAEDDWRSPLKALYNGNPAGIYHAALVLVLAASNTMLFAAEVGWESRILILICCRPWRVALLTPSLSSCSHKEICQLKPTIYTPRSFPSCYHVGSLRLAAVSAVATAHCDIREWRRHSQPGVSHAAAPCNTPSGGICSGLRLRASMLRSATVIHTRVSIHWRFSAHDVSRAPAGCPIFTRVIGSHRGLLHRIFVHVPSADTGFRKRRFCPPQRVHAHVWGNVGGD